MAHRGCLLPIVLWGLTACRQAALPTLHVQTLFGPVLILGGPALIVGRVDWPANGPGPAARLLTENGSLVRVDIGNRRADIRAIEPIENVPSFWGLARLQDGTLWTLFGRHLLLGVQDDGHVFRRVELKEPHAALFGNGMRLIYQVMDFRPPALVFSIGPPGESNREPWGDLRTRARPLVRAAAAAINLVACGLTRTTERPCWFPDDGKVEMGDEGGRSRTVALEGVRAVDANVLLAADDPPRPIRDAAVDADGNIWVISSGGSSSNGAQVTPGGWILARFDGSGRRRAEVRLDEPARLIIGIEGRRCYLLTSGGRVVEATQ